MAMASFLFVIGFVAGIVVIIALEALGVILLINRLNKKANEEETVAVESKKKVVQLDPYQSLDFAYNKQGAIWILESDKAPKIWLVDKVPKDQNRKKEFLEVLPAKKYAKIKDQSLILTETDGSSTTIPIEGCIIEAVSATNLSSKKWAKKFPIKVESKTSLIYNGSKTFFIYLDTSWEKESWCKALRLASCDEKERLNWFSRLNEEFHCYLTSLNTGYPSFMKPAVGLDAETLDRATRFDGSSSKVRQFFKKLSKKSSKVGAENRASWTSSSGREERKISEKFLPLQESVSASGLTKNARTAKSPNNYLEDSAAVPSSSTFTRSISQNSVTSAADSDYQFNVDEGTLCWNFLISRLFFDVKSSKDMKSLIQARIQRTLSSMRIPSYIGEITCTGIHLGDLPPCIHGMRVLPSEMNGVWTLEVDIGYSGGALLDVETRLEVRELDVQTGLLDANPESSSVVDDVSSDLIEGIEYFGKQFNLSEGVVDTGVQNDEWDLNQDGCKSTKSTLPVSASVSRWKSILNSVAKQVSQVPISLTIRVASLRGTLRLQVKPPPSDQLWFGFTSMPNIDFKLESSVGEHKITNGRVALFLISRFKTAIRETLVLPNCESACIPWMLAEKDDWVPSRSAPFIWVRQEAVNDHIPVHETQASQFSEMRSETEANRGTSIDHPERILKKSETIQQSNCESLDLSPLHSTNPSIKKTMSLQELQSPLFGLDKPLETCHDDGQEVSASESSTRSFTFPALGNHTIEEDDAMPKRIGRKARMRDLRNKMGEKLEEKNVTLKKRVGTLLRRCEDRETANI